MGFSNSLKTHLFHHNFDCKLFFGVKNGLYWKKPHQKRFYFRLNRLEKNLKTYTIYMEKWWFLCIGRYLDRKHRFRCGFFTSRESGLRNRLRAFPNLGNASLTLIQGRNRCIEAMTIQSLFFFDAPLENWSKNQTFLNFYKKTVDS